MITDYTDEEVFKSPMLSSFLSQSLLKFAQLSPHSFSSLESVEGAKCDLAGKQDNLLLQICGNLSSI